MNKLVSLCKSLSHDTKKPRLMTHVVVGFPTLEASIDIVRGMCEAGVDVVELQMPFTDPIADGSSIMEANQIALDNGITPADCFRAIEILSKEVTQPILIMSYFNLLYCYKDGLQGFFSDASKAGASGLIIPDIPPDEDFEGYWEFAETHGLVPIPLVAPTTSDDRLSMLSGYASENSFVYCVATLGTTGARGSLEAGLGDYLNRVRKYFNQPLAVGFGISTGAQVVEACEYANMAVVGSAMIDAINKTKPESMGYREFAYKTTREFLGK